MSRDEIPEIIHHKRPDDFKPEKTFPPERKRGGGKPRCQAWSSRNNRQCEAYPVAGMTKCKNHGGKSLRGVASANYKTGKYSKYLPKRMVENYHEALSDKELLELREQIAVLDARAVDLMQRVDIGEAGALWLQSRAAYQDLLTGMRSQDDKKIAMSLAVLDDTLKRGATDYASWHEWQSVIEQRRRLVETERRRLIDMQQMITSEQAVGLYRALTLAIKENVTDTIILRRIQEAFIRIASITDSRVVGTGQ